jgi:hypothetical protein
MKRAESLFHAPTHLLYLGQAEEKLGNLVSAHEAYVRIVREKLSPNASDAFIKAQSDAKKLLEALKPRLPLLTIRVVGAGTSTPEVTMDGKPLPAALVGIQHPVDPGQHMFKARAPGMQADAVTVRLAEGEKKEIKLALYPSADSPNDPADGASGDRAVGGEDSASANADAGAAADSGMSPWTMGGIVSLGVGTVGLGLGAMFSLQAASKRSDADAICTLEGGVCPAARQPEVEALESDAASADTASAVGFAVGGVGVAAGVTMLILGALQDSSPESAWVMPYVGPYSGGVCGRF